MIPAFLCLVVYRYVPMGGLIIAFKDFRIARGVFGSAWNGLENFRRFFSSPFFSMVMINTLLISLYKIVFAFPVPIVLALMMNEVKCLPCKRFVQTTLYFPHFISWVVIANLVYVFLAPRTGAVINAIFDLTGLRINVVMNPKVFRGLLVATDIWKDAGWHTIIYLAAIAGIDTSMYEAATIDGATRLQQIRYITIPSIAPVVLVLFVLRVGLIMNAGFEQIFVMQNPMVYEVSEILDTFVYKMAFSQGQFALGATVGLFKAVVGFILVLTSDKIAQGLGKEVM
jgi:putative aldouronate transport system permease protein